MKALLKTIDVTVDEELGRAQEQFSAMNSAHEGYAIILEEVQELDEARAEVSIILSSLWGAARRNDTVHARDCAHALADHAQHAAAEAIQVAAMARRFLADIPEEG